MMELQYKDDLIFARAMDSEDSLASFRSKFHFPKLHGKDALYFCGNSLGLQPTSAKDFVMQEMADWADKGVMGHHKPGTGWFSYHELMTPITAEIVGAKPEEVVNMNSLTLNLHLLMVSFFRPKGKKNKILIEAAAFPSDQYAVQTQLRFHGLDPEKHLLTIAPRAGEDRIRLEDIQALLDEKGSEIALIMLGGVHYLTGQAFDMEAIVKAGHKHDCIVGFDLAHAAGNLALKLHDWQVDFAAWCSYKYLNAGPGALAGLFVHENRIKEKPVRFAGWWGHDKERRFLMEAQFVPMPTAEGWQLSNPPILQAAALRASLAIFHEAGMERLRYKSEKLTGYLEFLLNKRLAHKVRIVTPDNPRERGAQLSLRLKGSPDLLHPEGQPVTLPMRGLEEKGVICDVRKPDIVRVAPTPLYNSFEDVYRFVTILEEILAS